MVFDITAVVDFAEVHKYAELIKQTNTNQPLAIKKHVNLFKNFMEVNHLTIRERNKHKLKGKKIKVSNKVFLDFYKILDALDDESSNVLWDHLDKILDLKESQPEYVPVEEIKKEIEELTSTIDPEKDDIPGIIQNIMTSPGFENIVHMLKDGIENQTLDIGSLLSPDMLGGLGLPNLK